MFRAQVPDVSSGKLNTYSASILADPGAMQEFHMYPTMLIKCESFKCFLLTRRRLVLRSFISLLLDVNGSLVGGCTSCTLKL